MNMRNLFASPRDAENKPFPVFAGCQLLLWFWAPIGPPAPRVQPWASSLLSSQSLHRFHFPLIKCASVPSLSSSALDLWVKQRHTGNDPGLAQLLFYIQTVDAKLVETYPPKNEAKLCSKIFWKKTLKTKSFTSQTCNTHTKITFARHACPRMLFV